MEISVTFLVMLILSITIFSFGIYLVREFFGFAQETQEAIDMQTQAEIERRLLDAGEKVSIPINKAKVDIGTSKQFGLGVLNTYREPKSFPISMAYVRGFMPDGSVWQGETPDQGHINENWIYTSLQPVHLGPNEHAVVPITIRVAGKMSPTLGTKKGYAYVFNVCVYKDEANKPDCAQIEPADLKYLHGEQVLKIYAQAD